MCAAASSARPLGGEVIALRAADKVFGNGLRALQPLDLAVSEGEIVTIVGPSGCGKSTLLRMVAGLVAPSSGTVFVDPRLRSTSGPLAFVFQHPTLMPWSTAQNNARLPLDLAGVPENEKATRVQRALELVELAQFGHAYPRELSGGMQMRVSIARALATGPRLLLMDEPFGALDEISRNRLDRDVSTLAARERLTIVFVTHSIYEAAFLSHRVLVMSARPGRLLEEVMIDAPHPRQDSFRASETFSRACARLSRALADAAEEAQP
jgi:NitT/TauT family transport system ATP-binding protein